MFDVVAQSERTSASEPRAQWGRPLAVVAAIAFCISAVFPVVAGLSRNTAFFPKWWGTLDVGLAFVLAILVFAIFGVTNNKVTKQAEDTTYRTYRCLIHVLLAMTVVFMLAGDRITLVLASCMGSGLWNASAVYKYATAIASQ